MSEELVVEQALKSWSEKKTEIKKLQGELGKIENLVHSLCSSNKKKGMVEVCGQTLKAKITRKENISYSDKDLLKTIVKQHSKVLGSIFKIELKEDGNKVEEFLDEHDVEHESTAAKLAAIRVKKTGKPGFEVVANDG